MVLEHTEHYGLLRMRLRSCRLIRVSILTPGSQHRKQKAVKGGDLICFFFLHHTDSQACVRLLPGEHMAAGCTMGGRQAGGGTA